jgi:hypothetical protein
LCFRGNAPGELWGDIRVQTIPSPHFFFSKTTTAVPSTARLEGYEHGDIKANGVVIDLSELLPSASPDFDEISGWSVEAWVDRNNPAHTFHFYIQYDHLNPVVVFGYDLLVEPVKGTDKIKCTSAPSPIPRIAWRIATRTLPRLLSRLTCLHS